MGPFPAIILSAFGILAVFYVIDTCTKSKTIRQSSSYDASQKLSHKQHSQPKASEPEASGEVTLESSNVKNYSIGQYVKGLGRQQILRPRSCQCSSGSDGCHSEYPFERRAQLLQQKAPDQKR